MEKSGADIEDVMKSLESLQKSEDEVVNRRIQNEIGDVYKTSLKYLDTKRDRDTVTALLAKISSVKSVMKLAEVSDKRSIKRNKHMVFSNLINYEEMKNDITLPEGEELPENKRRLKIIRILEKKKIEHLRHIYRGRGRMLKCEEFPDLAGILEFPFGDEDRVNRAGGGLESHPRLTDTVLYRAADNNTIMKQARETILALAPDGFSISLSSCFNYTQNYREGTYQAKRHHSGRGINACISLHKPPRTGVEKLVVNLHWTTHNVNLTLDVAHLDHNNFMVDSKDAKAMIQSDVSPVQKPGKTWKKSSFLTMTGRDPPITQ